MFSAIDEDVCNLATACLRVTPAALLNRRFSSEPCRYRIFRATHGNSWPTRKLGIHPLQEYVDISHTSSAMTPEVLCSQAVS